jgi:hypothetical protein
VLKERRRRRGRELLYLSEGSIGSGHRQVPRPEKVTALGFIRSGSFDMGPSLEIVRNEAVSASLIEFSVHGLDSFETTGDAEEFYTQTNVGIRICAWRRTFIDTMHAKDTGLR